jgi:hypothetical protein
LPYTPRLGRRLVMPGRTQPARNDGRRTSLISDMEDLA